VEAVFTEVGRGDRDRVSRLGRSRQRRQRYSRGSRRGIVRQRRQRYSEVAGDGKVARGGRGTKS
jgi:hypothetical protein